MALDYNFSDCDYACDYVIIQNRCFHDKIQQILLCYANVSY